MNGYQTIQQQQNDEIKRLQYEITRIRGEHVDGIFQMKLSFKKKNLKNNVKMMIQKLKEFDDKLIRQLNNLFMIKH